MNNLQQPEGATPLTLDDIKGLIPKHITSQGELNAVEQMNVAKRLLRVNKKKLLPDDILNQKFIRQLHKKLFGDVWRWAGQFRKTNKNIGVNWLSICVELKKLLDDAHFHIQHHSYKTDEIAVRFHHRLVLIHPFPNGNGRHARIITDQLLKSLGIQTFTWGGHNIQAYSHQSKNRKNYITALRKADMGDIRDLMKFSRQSKNVTGVSNASVL
jgi:Fic-DOC domain mobile mystery protein B